VEVELLTGAVGIFCGAQVAVGILAIYAAVDGGAVGSVEARVLVVDGVTSDCLAGTRLEVTSLEVGALGVCFAEAIVGDAGTALFVTLEAFAAVGVDGAGAGFRALLKVGVTNRTRGALCIFLAEGGDAGTAVVAVISRRAVVGDVAGRGGQAVAALEITEFAERAVFVGVADRIGVIAGDAGVAVITAHAGTTIAIRLAESSLDADAVVAEAAFGAVEVRVTGTTWLGDVVAAPVIAPVAAPLVTIGVAVLLDVEVTGGQAHTAQDESGE
jgi:hypothetical protein